MIRRYVLGSGIVAGCATFLCGCTSEVRSGGPDIAYLENASRTPMTATLDNPLLSLTKGNFWEMTAYRQDATGKTISVTKDRYVVAGPTNVAGIDGTEIRIERAGKLWRREVYRQNKDVLELVAAQDENAPLMSYKPPIPLLKYPVKEGDYQTWIGELYFDKELVAGRAQSRIAGQETMKTPAGIFKTLRVDTMLLIGDGKVKFPSARWFAPGVGFVRRWYAEKNLPGTAEVTRFSVR